MSICEHQAADWAITCDDGVVDRFTTEQEATTALAEGGYPADATVEFVCDPNPCGDDPCVGAR